MKKDYSDEKVLLAAIYQEDPEAYHYIRTMYFGMVKVIVGSNGGSGEDVEDIFSEGIYAIAEKARRGTLGSSARLSTFLYDIWYKMWAKELRDRNSDERNSMHLTKAREWSPEEALDRKVYEKVAWQCYAELSKDCRKIIKYITDEKKYSEIASLMKTTSGFIKKRSHECKKRWLKLIKSHPGYLGSGEQEKSARK